MRTTFTLAACSGLAMAMLVGVPAATADQDAHTKKIQQAAATMLQERDVPSVLGAVRSHEFQADFGSDRPVWLCDPKSPVTVGRVSQFYSSEVGTSVKGQPADVDEHVFVYANESVSSRVWTRLVGNARKCIGTVRKGDWSRPGSPFVRFRYHNGRTSLKSEGARGVWLRSDAAGSQSGTYWARDEYSVYLRAGRTIHLLDFGIDSEAVISKQQRTAVRRLAGTLTQRTSDARSGGRWWSSRCTDLAPNVDCSGKVVSGKYLNVNVSGGKFVGTKFGENGAESATDLTGAIFNTADMTDATAARVVLAKIKMQTATIHNVSFRYANLTGANLSNSKICYSDFRDAKMSGVTMMAYNGGKPWCTVFYKNARTKNYFNRADLSGANLQNGAVGGAAPYGGDDFTDANLAGANLRNFHASYANFTNANMSNVDLSFADLSGAILKGANLSGATLHGATTNNQTTCPSGSPGPCW